MNGAVVNLGSISPLVTALNAQADNPQNAGCTYAKNLVAGAIKQIVDRYRASNPNSLKYVVIVGGDSVVPYFRYPDTAGLGPELTYVPPVLSTSPSEASLQGNQVLSQDAYGSSTVLHLKGIDLPVPGLPVGRLVETPSEIVTMINAYLGLGAGVVPTPHILARHRLRLHGERRQLGRGRPRGRARRGRDERHADQPAGNAARPVVDGEPAEHGAPRQPP